MFIIRALYRKNGNDVANKSILIFVFEKQSNFDTFINSSWELGDQATTAAKMGEEGGGSVGAMAVSPGGWMY